MLRRIVTPLLDVHIKRWRCCSRLGATEVILTQEFLPGAQALRVELQTPWPVCWNWLMPCLAAQVLDSGRRPMKLETVRAQSCQSGILSLSLTFPARAVAEQAVFYIRLFTSEHRATLTEVAFTPLDRNQLLGELKVRRLEAYACIGARRVVTQQPHSGLEQLGAYAELQLSDAEHRALFRQVPAQVTMALLVPHEGVAWKTRLEFAGDSFRWDVALTEALPLFRQHPGDYHLTLLLEEHMLASLPLHVRSEQQGYAEALKEVEAQASLQQCRCEAVNHRGQIVPVEVVAEDFREMRIEALIVVAEHDRLFDEFSLPLGCAFRSRDGQAVISRRALDLTLRPGANAVRLRLLLQPHQFHRATRDCVLELCLGNRILADIPVAHKTRRQIVEEKTARLLESLSIAGVELAVEREGQPLVTDIVFATDRRLNPRFTVRAEGFDEDVPRLQWQLTIQLRHLASRRTFEQTRTLRIRTGTNRCHSLAVPLEQWRATLPPGRCTLSLFCAGRLLARREFRFLAEDEILPYTQQLVLANLRVLDQELVCESRNQAYATETVPFCAERIRVRCTLQSEGFNAAMPEWNLPVHLKLAGDQLPCVSVCHTTVTLSGRPATLDLPLSVAGTPLAERPGNYQIELHLNEREIARFQFRMVSEAEIVEQIGVPAFEMTAVRHQGMAPVQFNQLNFEEHRELRISFRVRVGFLAPGFALPGRVELVAGLRVLFSSDFLSPLDQEATTRELNPLPVAALWARAGERDQTLHVQISVGGTVKYRHPLKLQLRTRMTNFEGALTQDPGALRNVDAEYDEILQELGR